MMRNQLSQLSTLGWCNRPYKYPPTPAMIITQIGENPSSQMISADTMGIQTL